MTFAHVTLEQLGLGTTGATFFLSMYLVLFLCVIILAFQKNKLLLATDKTAHPYKWGYFVGYLGLVKTALIMLFVFSSMPSMYVLLNTIIFGAVFLLASYGIILRKKLGWLIILLSMFGTVLTVPVCYFWYSEILQSWGLFINYSGAASLVILVSSLIYVKKRWKELGTCCA